MKKLIKKRGIKPKNNSKFIYALPSIISLLKLVILPFVLWMIFSNELTAALALFVLIVVVDIFDGLFARALGAETKIGAVIDGITDSTALFCILVALAYTKHISWFFVLAIFSFTALSYLILALVKLKKKNVSKLIKSRKVHAALIYTFIALILLKAHEFIIFAFFLAVIVSVISRNIEHYQGLKQ